MMKRSRDSIIVWFIEHDLMTLVGIFMLLLSSNVYGALFHAEINPFQPTWPQASASNWVTYDYKFFAYPSWPSNAPNTFVSGDVEGHYYSANVNLVGINYEMTLGDSNVFKGAAEMHMVGYGRSCDGPNCSSYEDGAQTVGSTGAGEDLHYSPSSGAAIGVTYCDGYDPQYGGVITYTNAGFYEATKYIYFDQLEGHPYYLQPEQWDQIPLIVDIISTNQVGAVTTIKIWKGIPPLFFHHEVFNFRCPNGTGSAFNAWGNSGYLHISVTMDPGATVPTNLVGVGWTYGTWTNLLEGVVGAALVFPPVPNVNGVSQNSGSVGASVVISGADFSPGTASNIVYFGAVRATVTAATATNLTVTVPGGATYGPILVSTDGLTTTTKTPFVPTFSPSSTNITFSSKTNLPTTTAQLAVVSGDLNGDGKADIATVNSQGTSVSVFTNGSVTGTFLIQSNYSTGNTPYACALGDLDGDGLSDIIVGNCSDQTVSVYVNHTNNPGTFTSAGTFAVNANPTRIAVGDLDGDGRLDLAVATSDGSGNNGISILLNASILGLLSFNDFVAISSDPSDGSNAWDVEIADLDGDGKPDLATSSYDSGKAFLFHNNITNSVVSFGSPVAIDVGTTLSMVIGDLDNDSKPDLVFALYADDSVVVIKNNSSAGTFSFESPVAFATAAGPRDVAIADISGDGWPDLVVCDADASSVSVLRNTGSATIDSSLFAAKVDFTSGSSPSTVAIGDIDADGRPDLMISRWGGAGAGTLAILKNTTAP